MITLHQVLLPTDHSLTPTGRQSISLHIKRGSVLWLHGPAGSGKTKLLETIALQHPLQTGSMRIMERDAGPKITEKTRGILQRCISYLPARPTFFETLNIFDNIALPLELNHLPHADIIKETGAILRWFQLDDQAHKHPSQVNFTTLQRAACARALITQPAILLVDEPIFSLSRSLRELFFSTIKELTRNGTTTLLATQDNTYSNLLPGDQLLLPIASPQTSHTTAPFHTETREHTPPQPMPEAPAP